MADDLDKNPEDHFPDLKHLIRSIQHIEGSPECYGKVDENCERQDCLWREYCLKET